ncbi:copper chaperone PCu(A)C [Pseudonocardia bannensis]|uniref:Copper chaperone PCu(A)C n=1 Tax=Pseudonocardia bannensis TaxID=630973 RepID=A0A848DNF4_9PSEU|nr:copper chaperone PCu(A)C [Pseudonocardia bannensis]NMH94238.1 copper chaperone PCu(A)C [Pseudonocardia bannensis]
MSRTKRFRPTGAAVLIGAMIGMVGLAGCGAGQISQTSNQTAAVSGANVTVGHIAVRNALIEYPVGVRPAAAVYRRGENAPVQLTIVNESDAADRLLRASSRVAGSVQLAGDGALPGDHVITSGTKLQALPNSHEVQVTLAGLTDEIRPGLSYPVVLTFERAGDVVVDLPVGSPAEARLDEPASGGGGH